MKTFKELLVPKPTITFFVGNKINIYEMLNREIIVHDYKIEPSKYTENYLQMQISIGDNKHVVFTGSKMLANTLEAIPPDEFPFKATICKNNKWFEFN